MHTLLAALSAILITLGSWFHHAPPPVAGTTATWVKTTGQTRYDTPSGDLDLGFYVLTPTSILAHTATTTLLSATSGPTTIPDGIRDVNAIPKGFIEAHAAGTKYLDYFSDGTIQVGDPLLDAALSTKDAPVPVKGALGTTPL